MTSTQADLVIVGGQVRTLDPARPRATSVAMASGRIIAVGTEAEIAEHTTRTTEVIDVAGAAVVPGLVDSHSHPFLGALHARGADLMGARSLDEVRGRLAAERARCAPHEWVLGFGLDYNAFADTGISGELIVDAVSGAPALVTFVDFHTALATPRALELAGVDGPRAFTEHAEVVCAGGRPTGELREASAIALVQDTVPALTEAGRYDLYAEQLRRFAAVGLTGCHMMDGTLETPGVLAALEDRGDLVTRMVMSFTVTPDSDEAEWAAFAEHRDAAGARWRGGVAKFFIDGVIDSGTAWLHEADSEGAGLAPFWPDPARYREAVRFFTERGFQCVTHACGDRGVREALDAYRDAGRPRGRPSLQHRIEHIETLRDEELPRFAQEGVTASMQAQHMMELEPDRMDNWSRRLGTARCERAFPIRALRESGARLALGSDWPVARFDPREGLAAAQLRRPPGALHREPYDRQGIGGLAALEGYTSGAAYAVGDEHRLGRIAPGLLADLTVLEVDPVDCAPDALPTNSTVLTVVDGELVYRA